MSALAWAAVLVAMFVLGGLAYVLELLRRELRGMRHELRDWRQELPNSKTRTIRGEDK